LTYEFLNSIFNNVYIVVVDCTDVGKQSTKKKITNIP